MLVYSAPRLTGTAAEMEHERVVHVVDVKEACAYPNAYL